MVGLFHRRQRKGGDTTSNDKEYKKSKQKRDIPLIDALENYLWYIPFFILGCSSIWIVAYIIAKGNTTLASWFS